jgi:membrane protease YdiL (CAAX protease family)
MREALGRIFMGPGSALRNGWKIALFVVAVGLGDALLFQMPYLRPWLRSLGGQIPWVLFLLCLLVTWQFLKGEGAPLRSVGLRLDGRWAAAFATGTLAGVALMGVTSLVIWLAGGFHWIRTPGLGPTQLLFGGWVFLGVALHEELTFRGYLFQRMNKGLGPWGAQLVIAGFFALGHWGNPGMSGATKAWATVNIALASILLGLCYLKTRSLALPVGLHLGWNWAQGSLLGFGVSGTMAQGWWTPVFHGRPQWLTGGPFGLEASLPCAIICSFACLGLALWPVPKSFK